ncbi:hypothetical protein AVDCRST_MAG81-792 [uncultured Synechococcales cyanobacterium]|uniref:Uncharacterized protein n=1 Tax=uncultured Synechococcales cyanobacterium TaxID=1936017 RepID=A0A6J4V1N9_9CYAN|nr:hypothetical protein AVDCRST_MAG81-792 [uncultured Synechococcales cyanobacterium]
MQTTQLELSLWENLEQAAATPETTDLDHLWQELEAAIGPLPHEQRLQTAGKAIAQIVEVFALRCDLILSAWEEAHNDQGPAVDEDALSGLVRQTMTLDLSELMEEPVAEQRQRQSHTSSTNSVAGPVDKAALLEAFESEIELVESQAQARAAAMAVAHDEDIAGWASMITQWLELRQSSELVSLVQLQQEVGMPLVEVWLGLLLSQQQYEWEQQGDFYDTDGLYLKHNRRVVIA